MDYKKTIEDESGKYIGADERGKESLKKVMGVYNDVTKSYDEKDLKSNSKVQSEVVDKVYAELIKEYGSETDLRQQTGIDLATLIDTRKNFEFQRGVYGFDQDAFKAFANYIIDQNVTNKEQQNGIVAQGRIDKAGWQKDGITKLELLTGKKVDNPEIMDPTRLKNEYGRALDNIVKENENPLYKPFDLTQRLQMADDYLNQKAA